MNGPLSRIPLSRLVASALRPRLVIEGRTEEGRPSWVLRSKSPAKTPSSPSLEDIASDAGIDFIGTNDANSARVRARIRAAKPDALLVAGFPHLLSAEVLALSSKGGLNLHPGALPEERGPAPIFWALKDGRTRFTYTIHMLEVGEDTGDIVSTGTTDDCEGLSMREILQQIAEGATPALIQSLRALLEGDLVRHHQPNATIPTSRCPRPSFRDGLIDPRRCAKDVFTFVRGCSEAHSLFVESGADRFFVRSASGYDSTGRLGFEYVLSGDRLYLKCDPGFVELELKKDGALFGAESATVSSLPPTGSVL